MHSTQRLYDELSKTLLRIDEQTKEICEDGIGRSDLLVDLLVAKANCLAAMANLKAAVLRAR